MRDKTAKQDVEIVSKETLYQRFFRIDKYLVRYEKFEGGKGEVIDRELFERGQVAAVLPYDPERNKVVLIEQFRIGAMKDERSPWLLEAIAGVIEKNETPEELIHREAEEEAGIQLTNLTPICHYWVSPGGCTERVALYCGKVDSTTASGIHGLDHESEDIYVHVVDMHEAFDMVRNGMINNAQTIIGLQWLELNYKTLWKNK